MSPTPHHSLLITTFYWKLILLFFCLWAFVALLLCSFTFPHMRSFYICLLLLTFLSMLLSKFMLIVIDHMILTFLIAKQYFIMWAYHSFLIHPFVLEFTELFLSVSNFSTMNVKLKSCDAAGHCNLNLQCYFQHPLTIPIRYGCTDGSEREIQAFPRLTATFNPDLECWEVLWFSPFPSSYRCYSSSWWLHRLLAMASPRIFTMVLSGDHTLDYGVQM